MTSVTADTNIYISGLEFGGLPEQFLQLARDVSGVVRHVLPLGSYAGIPIVRVADFLERLSQAQ